MSSITPGMFKPVWQPPIELKWILVVCIVFLGALSNRLPSNVANVFINPVGFFLTLIVALLVYSSGFPPGSFAILFFLLLVWVVHKSKHVEGFLNGSSVDWVTNQSNRWYVEKVLKERPLGIQEKVVDTFPVQGATSQSSSTTGNT